MQSINWDKTDSTPTEDIKRGMEIMHPHRTIAHDCHEQARIDRSKALLENAARHEMTLGKFCSYLGRLNSAWEAGGGFEGARERLKFAESFLAEQKRQKNAKTLSQCWDDLRKATRWVDFVWWSMEIIKKILKALTRITNKSTGA